MAPKKRNVVVVESSIAGFVRGDVFSGRTTPSSATAGEGTVGSSQYDAPHFAAAHSQAGFEVSTIFLEPANAQP